MCASLTELWFVLLQYKNLGFQFYFEEGRLLNLLECIKASDLSANRVSLSVRGQRLVRDVRSTCEENALLESSESELKRGGVNTTPCQYLPVLPFVPSLILFVLLRYADMFSNEASATTLTTKLP